MNVWGQDAPDYYIASGKRVPLIVEETAGILLLQEGVNADVFVEEEGGLLDDAVTIEGPPPSFEARGYRIVVWRQREGAAERPEVNESLQRLRNSDNVEIELPVYRGGDVELLPVNQFMIRFEERAQESDSRALIHELGAVVERDDRISSGRYTVSFPGVPFRDALVRINGLNQHPSVRYAHPDFIRILPPRLYDLGTVNRPGADDFSIREVEMQGASGPACYLSAISSSSTDPNDPNDPMFPRQWALKNTADNIGSVPAATLSGQAGADVHAVDGWAVSKGSPEIRIAVIDLGVETDHPDLANKLDIYPEADVTDPTGDGDVNPQNPDREHHGTGVAGLAAAEADATSPTGIAGLDWYARIIPVRIGDTYDDGRWRIMPGDAASGIEKAVELGAHVLVNSWGGDVDGAEDTDLNEAIRAALEDNRVVVFAAGNHAYEFDPADPDEKPIESRDVDYPAYLTVASPHAVVREGLIAVGASNQQDELKTHYRDDDSPSVSDSFNALWGSDRGPEISLVAPGVHLYTTANGHDYMACFWGTSGAAPLVGAAAALLLSVHPTATPDDIKDWLQRGADDIPPADVDPFTGHGRLNIAGAFEVAKVDIDLEIQRFGEPIEFYEDRWVRAIVTRDGQGVGGVPVVFSSPELRSVDPEMPVTNAEGWAWTAMSPTSDPERRSDVATEITAYTSGTTVSQSVVVGGNKRWWWRIWN
jgi:subtilisin family serine protease